jgi:uncharacterized protein YjeT (DUF2065 family)
MAISNYLAELFGFTFVVFSLALLINPKNIKKLFSLLEDETYMFFGGLISFIIGVAILLLHNVWAKDWVIVVTIFGWLSVIKGMMFLFCPNCVQKAANKIKEKDWLSVALVVMVFFGLALVYSGFTF